MSILFAMAKFCHDKVYEFVLGILRSPTKVPYYAMLVDTVNLISDEFTAKNLNEIYPLLYKLLMDGQYELSGSMASPNNDNYASMLNNSGGSSSSGNSSNGSGGGGGGGNGQNDYDDDAAQRLTASLLKCLPRVNPQWKQPDRKLLEKICRYSLDDNEALAEAARKSLCEFINIRGCDDLIRLIATNPIVEVTAAHKPLHVTTIIDNLLLLVMQDVWKMFLDGDVLPTGHIDRCYNTVTAILHYFHSICSLRDPSTYLPVEGFDALRRKVEGTTLIYMAHSTPWVRSYAIHCLHFFCRPEMRALDPFPLSPPVCRRHASALSC